MSLEEDARLLRREGAIPVDGPVREFVTFDSLESLEPHVILPGIYQNRPMPITRAARIVRGMRLLEMLEEGEEAACAPTGKFPKAPRVPADIDELEKFLG